ncbi:hypothetical protein tb265_29890 [Gemmatimonadetes bacterium T265]|nr:hypothetical protein tb265_29890 [Gemmatimonadetes bacterium T265]
MVRARGGDASRRRRTTSGGARPAPTADVAGIVGTVACNRRDTAYNVRDSAGARRRTARFAPAPARGGVSGARQPRAGCSRYCDGLTPCASRKLCEKCETLWNPTA